jgi:hypothetical protein
MQYLETLLEIFSRCGLLVLLLCAYLASASLYRITLTHRFICSSDFNSLHSLKTFSTIGLYVHHQVLHLSLCVNLVLFLCGPVYLLVYPSVMGRCPCVWLCSYGCQFHVCAGVSLGYWPVSLCVAVLLWLPVPCTCWCIPRWWAGVPVCGCTLMTACPMYVLVYSLVMGRCPCVLLCRYDCQSRVSAGVSLGDGPVSLCVAVLLWLPVPCTCWYIPWLWAGAPVCCWCIPRWWVCVPVCYCFAMTASPMYVLVYPTVMDRCACVLLCCYDCQSHVCAGVSHSDGPVCLCVAVLLWLPISWMCWCIPRWRVCVPVCWCIPIYIV